MVLGANTASRLAVVTGGTRGIGRAIAERLAADGFDVAVIYHEEESAARQTVEALESYGRNSFAYRCDVADSAQAPRVALRIASEMGNPSVLVNNAGIFYQDALLRTEDGDFDRLIATNLKGAFNMTKAFSRYLLKAMYGRIVNVSSTAALTGGFGQAAYAASKAGVIGFTKSIAREYAKRGVTCNAVAPGYIVTDAVADLTDEERAERDAQIPMRRMGTVEDVAAAVSFLVSPAAGYITGEVIRIDGGMCM